LCIDLEPEAGERARECAARRGEGNLPRQSVLVVSQVSSVEKAQLGEYIGTLSNERIEQVLAGMRFQQASFFTR
jgi:mRNA interferase MazF